MRRVKGTRPQGSFMNTFKSTVAALMLATGLACGGAALADGPRNTGVGRTIAAQGNEALNAIKRDVREQLRRLAPGPPSAHAFDCPQNVKLAARAPARAS